jgi:type I restriction enzyme S subunit
MKPNKTNFKQTEIGMIPEDWEVKLFDDVCIIRRGASPRPIQEFISKTGIPWVKIADATAQKTRFIEWTNEFIKEEGRSSTVLVKPGDLIVSNSATPGLPKFMRINAAIHDGWLLIEPKSNINKDFIYYLFLNERKRLVGIADGSVFRNLKTDIVRSHKIVIPRRIDEQRAIAKILSDLDSKIEHNQQMNKTLEAIGQAIFKHWFVDFEFPNEEGKPYKSSGGEMFYNEELGKEIPKGWRVDNYGRLLCFEKGVEPGSKEYFSENFDGTVPFYRVADLVENKTNVFVNYKITKGKTANLGDVLVSFDGTPGRVSCCVAGAFSSGIRKVFDKNNYFPNSFIYFLMKSSQIQNKIIKYSKGTTILHAGEAINHFIFAIPPQKLVTKFTQLIDPIYLYLLKNLKESFPLSQIRDSLLPKLMSGKIRVPVEVR